MNSLLPYRWQTKHAIFNFSTCCNSYTPTQQCRTSLKTNSAKYYLNILPSISLNPICLEIATLSLPFQIPLAQGCRRLQRIDDRFASPDERISNLQARPCGKERERETESISLHSANINRHVPYSSTLSE